jgi:hypothetical protein
MSLEVTEVLDVLAASEMLACFYQTARCNNPEDKHFDTCRCKNLKCHFSLPFFVPLGKEYSHFSTDWYGGGLQFSRSR